MAISDALDDDAMLLADRPYQAVAPDNRHFASISFGTPKYQFEVLQKALGVRAGTAAVGSDVFACGRELTKANDEFRSCWRTRADNPARTNYG